MKDVLNTMDVQMIKQVEQRKERTRADELARKITKGVPVSVKIKINF